MALRTRRGERVTRGNDGVMAPTKSTRTNPPRAAQKVRHAGTRRSCMAAPSEFCFPVRQLLAAQRAAPGEASEAHLLAPPRA